ncbi:MAG: SPASM domain-containing protein [Ktedonobacteraceae bacterium]|nr:SPASM domain-containing protein [Ktedonobacteraceae bacterium]
MGNIFQQSIDSIWHGERYETFRYAFESNHPARHCSQCGLHWSY